MARVAFVVHPGRSVALDMAGSARAWLEDRGHEVLWPWDQQGDEPGTGTTGGAPDLVVSMGGDGTMLRAVDLAGPLGSPILGVNVGTLGYLTELEPGSLASALSRFLDGEFLVEERMTLEIELVEDAPPGPAPVRRLLALNEAVVEKTVPGHTVRVATSISGCPFLTYVADGLLIATPTGSTAYNLSVRGPIVSPGLQALLLTPISAHMLFDRTIVLDPAEWIRMDLREERPAALVVDGNRVAMLSPGAAVVARAGPHPARFVTFGKRDFYSILKAKFSLADR